MTDLFSKTFEAVLFDMDGTLINSLAAAERVWGAWARKHGLDEATFLPTIHGRRVTETIRAQKLFGVSTEAEAKWITRRELEDLEGIVEISGAALFLESIPADQVAIVTSAPRALAERRLAAAGVPIPRVLVCGEDVEQGKPAPDCFVLAADRLGVSVTECLVIEDAPAGIAAGEAAGATVVVMTATHHAPLATQHATLPSYVGLRMSALADGRLRLARLEDLTPSPTT